MAPMAEPRSITHLMRWINISISSLSLIKDFFSLYVIQTLPNVLAHIQKKACLCFCLKSSKPETKPGSVSSRYWICAVCVCLDPLSGISLLAVRAGTTGSLLGGLSGFVKKKKTKKEKTQTRTARLVAFIRDRERK